MKKPKKLEHNPLHILGMEKIYVTVMEPGFHCEVVLLRSAPLPIGWCLRAEG